MNFGILKQNAYKIALYSTNQTAYSTAKMSTYWDIVC